MSSSMLATVATLLKGLSYTAAAIHYNSKSWKLYNKFGFLLIHPRLNLECAFGVLILGCPSNAVAIAHHRDVGAHAEHIVIE